MSDLTHQPRRSLAAKDQADPHEFSGVGVGRKAVWSVLVAATFFCLSYPKKLLEGVYLQPVLLVVASAVVAWFAVDHSRWRRLRLPWPIAGFLLLGALSSLWSVSPERTAWTVALYTMVALLASIVATQTDPEPLARGVAWGGVLVVMVNGVAVWLNPADFGGRPLLGVHGNRNIIAYLLVLALAASLARNARSRPARVEALVTALIVAGGLVFALSTTGIATGCAVLVSAGFLRLLRQLQPSGRRRALGVMVVAVALVAAAAALFLDRLSPLLVKRTGLNGRVGIWIDIETVWREVPVAGHGWGAFWEYGWDYDWLRLGRSDAFAAFVERTGVWIPHGHNTVMDILPQLGLIGAAGALLIHGVLLFRGVRLFQQAEVESTFAILVFVAVVLNGITEPIMSLPIGWFMITAALAVAHRHRHKEPGDRLPRRAVL